MAGSEVIDGEALAEEDALAADAPATGVAFEGEGEPTSEALEHVASATALVPLKPPETVMPTAQEFGAMQRIAQEISQARGFIPNDLVGKPNSILAAILKGRELGIGPMQSLSDITIIDGRPALSAQLMLALIRKQGHLINGTVSDAQAVLTGKRVDTGEQITVEWTFSEAEKIRDRKGQALTDKANWRNYRQDMLWARCVGRLARRLFPDVIAGMGYAAEEMQDFDGDWDDPYGPQSVAPVAVDPAIPIPSSWAEIMDRVRRYGPDEAYGWLEWIDEAAVAEHGVGAQDLDRGVRSTTFFQTCQRFVVKLDELHSPDLIPPIGRVDISKVWAMVLPSGSALSGPNIPIDREEHLAHDKPAGAADEDIPFGEPAGPTGGGA